jgi:hypothetical protein
VVKAGAFDVVSSRLLNATADAAAADLVRRFETGEAVFDDETYLMIYSLAQCTPDMSAVDCRTCLREMITTIEPKYFVAGKDGGRAFVVRYGFRFETFPFFYGAIRRFDSWFRLLCPHGRTTKVLRYD